MPKISPAFSKIGRGFAAYLAPPSPDVIRFTVGQPDFDTPQAVVQSAIDALHRGETAYTRSQGSASLCDAVTAHLKSLNIASNPDDVVITPGCKQAILYALMTALTPGDEVLLLAPAWPSYDGMIRIFGGVPVHVPVLRPSYHPDFEALESNVTERTKAIMLNSPNNPTGAVYTPEEIQEIAKFAEKHDIWIIDDMIYSTLVWEGHEYTSPINHPEGKDRTITIGGWSKGWAMTGWRMGWITGPTEFMEAVKTCQTSAATHIPTFLMPSGEVALQLEDETRAMAESFANRRTVMYNGINGLPGVNAPEPEGAFYILADITGTGMTDIEFADRALSEARVQLIPGSLMKGGEGLIRLSYATSLENIHEGIERLSRWLSSIIRNE